MKDSELLSLCNERLNYNPDTGVFNWKSKVSNLSRIQVGDIAGGGHPAGYLYITLNKKPYGAHRLAFLICKKYLPKMVDHKNGHRSDNWIDNLRAADYSKNGMNRKINKNSSSGYKGVSWAIKTQLWHVSIMKEQKSIYLGEFKCKDVAAKAYNNAAIQLFGEFACLNNV